MASEHSSMSAWEKAWLKDAFNTGAWMTSKEGQLFFLCARGPHVKLVRDNQLRHVQVKLISQGPSGHVWVVDHSGHVWVRVQQNPLARALPGHEVMGIGTTEVVYEQQKWLASSRSYAASRFVTPAGDSYDSLDEITLPSSRWQWDADWELETTLGESDSGGWEFVSSGTSRVQSLFTSKTTMRRRAWLRTRSIKDPSQAWFMLPKWSKHEVVSIAVAQSGAWIVLDKFKIALREGLDPIHVEGRAFEAVEEPEFTGTPIHSGCIAVNQNNSTWLSAPDGSLYFRQGITTATPAGRAWVKVPNTPLLTHITVTSHALIGVGVDGNLHVFDAPSNPFAVTAGQWTELAPPSAQDVATAALEAALLHVFESGWEVVEPEPGDFNEYDDYDPHIQTLDDDDIDDDDDEGAEEEMLEDEAEGQVSGTGVGGQTPGDGLSSDPNAVVRRRHSNRNSKRRSMIQSARGSVLISRPTISQLARQQALAHGARKTIGAMRRESAYFNSDNDNAPKRPAQPVCWCTATENLDYIVCLDVHGDLYVRMGMSLTRPFGTAWLRAEATFLGGECGGIECCELGLLPFIGDVPLPALTSRAHDRVISKMLRASAPAPRPNFISQRMLRETLPETDAVVRWFNSNNTCKLRLDTRAHQLCLDVKAKEGTTLEDTQQSECHLLPLIQVRSVRPSSKETHSFRLETTVKHFQTVVVTVRSFAKRRDWVTYLQRWVCLARRQLREAESTSLSAPALGDASGGVLPANAGAPAATSPDQVGDGVQPHGQQVVAPALWAIDTNNRLWFCDLVSDHMVSEVGECSPVFDKCSYRDGKASGKIQFMPKLYWHPTTDLTCQTNKGPVVIHAKQVFASPAGLVWVLSASGRAYALVKGEEGGDVRHKRAWRYRRWHEAEDAYVRQGEQLASQQGAQQAVEPFAHPSWARRPTGARHLTTNGIAPPPFARSSTNAGGRKKGRGTRGGGGRGGLWSTTGTQDGFRQSRQYTAAVARTCAAQATAAGVHWVSVPMCPYHVRGQAGQERIKDVGLSMTAAWVVTSSGLVYVRSDVTVTSPIGVDWVPVQSPELVSSVCVRDGSVTILTVQGHVYTRVGFGESTPHGTHWETDHGAISSVYLTRKRPDQVVDSANALQSGVSITHDARCVCALSPQLVQIGLRSTYGRIVWQLRASNHEFTSVSCDGFSHVWGVDSAGYLRSMTLNMPFDMHRPSPSTAALEFPTEKERDQKPFTELPLLLWKSLSVGEEDELKFTFMTAACARPRVRRPPHGHCMLGDDTVVPTKECSSLGKTFMSLLSRQNKRMRIRLDRTHAQVRWRFIVDPLEVNAEVFARERTGLWWSGLITSKVDEREAGGKASFFLVHPHEMREDFWVDRTRVAPKVKPNKGALYIGLCVLVPRTREGGELVLATVIAVDEKSNTVTVEAAEANLRPYTRQFNMGDIFVGPKEEYRGLSPACSRF
ncbi:hypothetical protein PTSG_03651 [Salpingoeca rosetta]|uniref:Uncharacterized protein n=1 Tax=Salpingoeca rosetta (strain ATCC 50818 / BSB-021) TaxID=946362 RepID=F2U674_SALR5|nr:uncharacterized protein PTSG_03651 [Salpingoeca rosetta]EGD83015.1 hypothetical protein PTSG_03651 [Salpingoeca rosetta]|eukprot:XP_004995379.1 hypothetical protein PTSG_03651 [Salpingoeca rosetta]